MKTHKLKSWPDSFQAVWLGQKTAEFRKDDRGFEVGDELLLEEWSRDREVYTGRQITARITDILRAPLFDFPPGFAMLSLGGVTIWDRPEARTRFDL